MSTTVTVCSNVDSKCAVYDSTKHSSTSPYKCSGHRSSQLSRNFLKDTFGNDKDFPTYNAGDIIEAIHISSVCETLKSEIAARKEHVLYKNVTDSNLSVTRGDLIDNFQPNTLAECIQKLSKIVNNNSKFGDTHLGNKKTSFANIDEGNIVETDDVKQFNDALSRVNNGLNALVQDCICYSDCTNYYSYTKTVCSCVSNYGCGYY